MAIPLPAATASTIEALTPRQIVAELDKHVVGQHQAKRAVAIALRNQSAIQGSPFAVVVSAGEPRQHATNSRLR